MISLFTNLPVFIQTPNEATIFLETQPSYTIGKVKTMIRQKRGVALKLRFADQLLEDGHTLSDYNIQIGSTIYIGMVDVCVPLMLLASSKYRRVNNPSTSYWELVMHGPSFVKDIVLCVCGSV